MALTMAKPAPAASSAAAPQRLGGSSRVFPAASQPDFPVPEIDAVQGVGARAPDTDPNAGWQGPGEGDGGRRRRNGQGAAQTANRGAFPAPAPADVRPTTVSDVILASQIVARRIGSPVMPRSEVTVAVGLYDHAIRAVTGTLPVTYIGTRLNVAL